MAWASDPQGFDSDFLAKQMQIRYLGDMRYELICKNRNVLASSREGKDSLLSHQGSPMRTKGMKRGDKTVKKRKVAFRMEEEDSGRDKSQ